MTCVQISSKRYGHMWHYVHMDVIILVRKVRRVPGATRIARGNGEELLIEHDSDMSQAICLLIKSEQEVGTFAIKKGEVKKIVKEEVREELISTN